MSTGIKNFNSNSLIDATMASTDTRVRPVFVRELQFQKDEKHEKNAKRFLVFQSIICPVLRVQRAMGFAVFHIDHVGKLSCGFHIWSAVYCALVYFGCASTTLITQYKIFKDTEETGTSTLSGYLKILAVTPQLFGPIPFLLQRKKFQRFLEKWSEFQEAYERLTLSELQLDKMLNLRKAGMYLMATVALLPFLQLPFIDVDQFELIRVITFVVFIIHQFCIILYWLLTSKAIDLSARKYKEHFTQEVRSRKGYTKVIEEYRLLWLRMCQIVRNFASSIGVTITICLVFHIMYAVLALYRTTTALPEYVRKADVYNILFLVVDLGLLLSVVLFYCNVGHNVPKYCINDMLTAVLQIKEVSLVTGLDDARINIFLFMLSEYVPMVSVSGFYEINRPLFGGILSVLITYIIVIIQLKDSI